MSFSAWLVNYSTLLWEYREGNVSSLIILLLHQYFENWRCLVQCMARTPTTAIQLVVNPPTYISYTDACKLGAGRVCCSRNVALKPFLWKIEWPINVQDSLIVEENPRDSITINYPKLESALLGLLALEASGVDLTYTHIAEFYDNMTTVAWAHKLSTSKSLIA